MNTSSLSPNENLWHEGELTLQRSVGAVERMVGPGRRQMARNYMPDQHREFYAQLPFVVLGTVDRSGEVWATLRAGQPGFMHSPQPQRLVLDLAREPNDPADEGMESGEGIGMLGIELHTRRRNKLNGIVRRNGDTGFEIEATQAYGICPRYIHLRQYAFTDSVPGPVIQMPELNIVAQEMITAADSFYVASYVVRDGMHQVDASHRGGKPGFVKIDTDGTLTIPDFSGNHFFNTLGNFLINPRAGLVFVNFRTGDLLQMTGLAEVILESPEIAAFVGAERMWRFKPHKILFRPAALVLRWLDTDQGASPNALMTGSWEDVSARIKAAELAQQWRPFRVDRIVDESRIIRSFYMLPADDAGMPAASAGQHVLIKQALPGADTSTIRTYTLSSAPSDRFMRISVKREGVFSNHLHDRLKSGDIVEVRAPAGNFTIDASVRRPVVLLAAGVGVTPMVSMVRHLVHEAARTRYQRPVWLFQSARSKSQRAFDQELASLVQAGKGCVHHIRVLSQTDDAESDKDYEVAGRMSLELLKQSLPLNDYDFYLCGPAEFMQDMYDALRGMNIADQRIHAEAFGPSSLKRSGDKGTDPVTLAPPSDIAVSISFLKSAKEAHWTPGSGTLLELAEQRGLTPEFSCRNGSCGTCRTRIIKGAVTYRQMPEMEVASDEALICCAMPARDCDALQLDL